MSGQGDRRTAHQMVRDALRRAILEGALPAGTRLVQAEIAEQLEVSTTPVREALRDLATEGLVQLDAHRGAVVHSTSLEEVEEIYDLRGLLEPEAVRRAAINLTEVQLDELDRLQHELDVEHDLVRWTELNRSFHRLIVSGSGSGRLAETVHRLEDLAALYLGVALRSGSIEIGSANAQHRDLLDALRVRDGERAAELVADHLEHTLVMLRRSESVFDEPVPLHAVG